MDLQLSGKTAGVTGIEGAASLCRPGYAFAGGTVVMVQYYDWGFDSYYICPGSQSLIKHPEPLPIEGGPRGRTSAMGGVALPYWHVLPLVAN
jgi:hypothetical protein